MTAPRRERFARLGAIPPQWVLLALIAIWGSCYAAVKLCLDAGLPAATLVAVRFGVAGAFLAAVLRVPRADWHAARRPGLLAGIALATGFVLQTLGITETTASMAGFLAGLIVPFVALGAWLVLREPMAPRGLLGLALALIGVAALCAGSGVAPNAAEPSADQAARATSTAFGITLQLGSSAAFAAHILMIQRLCPRGRETAFCIWQFALVTIAAAAVAPWLGGWGPWRTYAADPVVWGSMAYLAVLGAGIGVVLQSRVQPRVPSGQVAVLFSTQPAFAALAGVLVLGDYIGGWEVLGAGLIIAGVLATRRPARP